MREYKHQPVNAIDIDEVENNEKVTRQYFGLTKLEYFTAAALTGLLATGCDENKPTIYIIARAAAIAEDTLELLKGR